MNTVDMTFLKPTDMDTNRLVMMPGPRPALEEAKMEVRKNIWMNETERFIKEYCHENGKQREDNLSPAASRGRHKVEILIRKKRIVVMPSDKGKKWWW